MTGAPKLNLGRYGAWFNPRYDDDTRVELVARAESLGYPTAWLGFGSKSVSDLRLAERALAATSTITVATAIVNMWTNDPAEIVASYHRIASRYNDRLLLGVGIGHPESIGTYQRPVERMVSYFDALDAGGVPPNRRILAALGPRSLRLGAQRGLGTHPYLVVPAHTREARQLLGPTAVVAPEHKVIIETDAARARSVARAFLADPYLHLRNYTDNLRRHGYEDQDFEHDGSDRLVDALVLHGTLDHIVAGLNDHIEAGADHVAVQVLEAPGTFDPLPAYRALARALGELDPAQRSQNHLKRSETGGHLRR